MRIARIRIDNFRGVKHAELLLPQHAVLVGDNNSGKSTILEAIDLVLGPDRLARRPPVDEHDFFAGNYIGTEDTPVSIFIEIVVVELTDEQHRRFRNHLEWWHIRSNALLEGPPASSTDQEGVVSALRVVFKGHYDDAEDDFVGTTHYQSPMPDSGSPHAFTTTDKRLCGFLFLRTLRTGSRALSLERGSLLDIIIRFQENRAELWEDVLVQLRGLNVAEKPELGISMLLQTLQEAVQAYVPTDWSHNPHLRVSDLTREHLRKTITVFMATGAKLNDGTDYAAPFQHQGTGTINTLVLALLSMVAQSKQNVIFAMEEPEIAIPPHTQRSIVNSLRGISSQALFTSHSPYVLEEFPPSQVILIRREDGELTGTPTTLPPAVKAKAYRTELKKRFCECLLARHVLILEGRTEFDAFPAAARHLHELDGDRFKTLESLGIALIDAETDSQVLPLARHFLDLGKTVFCIFDRQTSDISSSITDIPAHIYESPEKGFEQLILNQTPDATLRRLAMSLVADAVWPSHLSHMMPTESMSIPQLKTALAEYMKHGKGSGAAAGLLSECNIEETPSFVISTLESIYATLRPSSQPDIGDTEEDVLSAAPAETDV